MLSDDDVSLASSMIEQSDNDAADALWAEIGSDPAVRRPTYASGCRRWLSGTDGYWGLGTTGAGEQLALLKNLVTPGGPLDAPRRRHTRSA